ncbi:hypothetical protein, partial [Vibrio harveyi]|uniref:hypothetical protein n=2 Tax=Vibrio harveyi TaxID=669 RepID=UPI001E564D98
HRLRFIPNSLRDTCFRKNGLIRTQNNDVYRLFVFKAHSVPLDSDNDYWLLKKRTHSLAHSTGLSEHNNTL